MFGLITKSDHSVMRLANNWDAPRWLRFYAMAATRAGDGWLWYATGLAVLFWGGDHRFAALAAAGLSSALSALVFLWLKQLAGRPRPCHMEPHCWAKLLPPDQFSFPSGHTMTAFALTISLASFYPGITGALLFCAFSIGLSRILLGMHFLSDVLVGAVIGGAIGYLGYLAFR